MVGRRIENFIHKSSHKTQLIGNADYKRIGGDMVSYERVRKWRKKFLNSTVSQDTANSGQPVTVTSKANVSKFRKITRFAKQLLKCFSISIKHKY